MGELAAYFISMAFAAGAIGAFITAVDTSDVRVTPESKRRFIRGFVICFLLSFLSTYLGNFVFNWVLQTGGVGFSPNGELVSGSIITLWIARWLGWGIDGALVGAGVGLATLTMENVPEGSPWRTGGWCHRRSQLRSHRRDCRRRDGFAVLRRSGHRPCDRIVHRAGARADQGSVGHGRAGPAARTPVPDRRRARSIGRAEENPVGLFGDPTVQARHAVIERRGADYMIRNLAVQDGTFVNGKRIESVDLRDGDRITIGGYEMLFHLRGTAAPARQRSSLAVDTMHPAQVATRLAGANAKVRGRAWWTRRAALPRPLRCGSPHRARARQRNGGQRFLGLAPSREYRKFQRHVRVKDLSSQTERTSATGA